MESAAIGIYVPDQLHSPKRASDVDLYEGALLIRRDID